MIGIKQESKRLGMRPCLCIWAVRMRCNSLIHSSWISTAFK